VKHFPLENRIFKLSYGSYFFTFEPEPREIWLNESDPAVKRMSGSLEALNTNGFSPQRNRCMAS